MSASITIRPAITALVVAMAGMILPAMAVRRERERGRERERERERGRERGGERNRERERVSIGITNDNQLTH